jgi:hypothetical protein
MQRLLFTFQQNLHMNNRIQNIAYASCSRKLFLLGFETEHSLTHRNKQMPISGNCLSRKRQWV